MTAKPRNFIHQGPPIVFTPAKLRQLEERLVIAEKCGIEEIAMEGQTLLVSYGKACAAGIRQKFSETYGAKRLESMVGPEPKYLEPVEPEEIRMAFQLSAVRADKAA